MVEFFRLVKGFYDRQEMEWKRVYTLWAVQIKGEAPSFDEFMGRKPVLSDEEKFQELWELLERDRAKAVPKVTDNGSSAS